MSKERDTIEAIHKEDLKELLLNFELFDEFQQSKIKCKYCNEIINTNNICAIIINEGNLDFICIDDDCFDKLSGYEKGDILG